MSRPWSWPYANVAAALVLFSGLVGVLALPASAATMTSTYEYTGAAQTWTAPAGATKATFDVYGAAGSAFDNAGLPNRGGHATATLPVTAPRQEFGVYVGGHGVEYATSGGFNGGGSSNRFPGGDASDVRVGGTALADRAVVAGGGGGGTTNCTRPGVHPGVGGGLVGGDGFYNPVCVSLFGASLGTGGTQSQGGTNAADAGAAGGLGFGGRSLEGGGGGGGFYGGAGGSGTGEGGGGSGFGPAGVVFESGVRDGDGLVTISPLFPLAISVLGSGTGRVASSPAGIDCASASTSGCSADFAGDEVTLQAAADEGSTFLGWDGADCSGTADCVVTVDAAETIRATFAILTPPETEITAAPAALGSDPRPPVAFSTPTPDATFECSLDDAPFTSCTSPYRPAEALADGPHTVAVRAVSQAGVPDPSPAIASFTVDTRAPAAPALLGGPPARGTSTSAQVAFAIDSDATASCQVDGGAFTPCTSPLTLTGLGVGPHTVAVRQTDAAGNASGLLVVSFTVLAPDAPTPPVDPPGPRASTAVVLGTKADHDGRYPVIVRDGVAQIGCSVSSGALASCSLRAVSVTSLKASPKRLPVGTMLAAGTSAQGVAASPSLAATLTLTKPGRAALARRPLGVTARVTVASRTATDATLTSTVLVRLQSANRLILPVGGHGTTLPASTKKLLARMTRTVTAAKTVTCVADTDTYGTAASDLALTRRQARVACTYLRDRGIQATVRSSGNGHQRPRASNRTARGRALNRRLTLTTTY